MYDKLLPDNPHTCRIAICGQVMRLITRILLGFVLWALTLPVMASATSPLVDVVFFYSPRCIHCHEVIENILPGLTEKYGNQLEIILVNTATEQGDALYEQAIAWWPIPKDREGFPTLLIGKQLMVGSIEIPKELPAAIEKGLQEGGIPLPPIPGLQEAINEHLVHPDREGDPIRLSSRGELKGVPKLSLKEKLTSDPVGNGVAIALLVIMLISIIAVIIRWSQEGWFKGASAERWGASVLIPILAVIGMFVAGYLTYIDFTGHSAVCGPLGNCNAVQQSVWAQIAGIPVAVFGLAAYVVIFVLWFWQRFGRRERTIKTAWIIPMIALIGVCFSVYLTFLEPFVIGAVCLWCLVSALMVTIILWISRPWRRYGNGVA